MAGPVVTRVAEACVFAFCLTVAAHSQTRSIQGMVSTSDGLPVGRATVSIDGRVVDTTGDSGGFHTPLQPPLRVGFPVIFTVVGWVVIDPCSGDRGREYLPDPDAEVINLKVLRPRDPRLLKTVGMTCLLTANSSRLPAPKKKIAGVPGASLRSDDPTSFAGAVLPALPGIWDSRGAGPFEFPAPGPTGPFLLPAAYHPPFQAQSSPADSSHLPPQVDDAFLAEQAKELGFSTDEIKAAITNFSKSAEDPWQKGLVAIYEGRFAEAVGLIHKSIEASPSDIDRYVPLGYAEYMQGHYAAAEAALRKVLAVHPNDPLLLTNLGTVLGVEGKNNEAEDDLKKAISLNEVIQGADSTVTAQSRSMLGVLYLEEAKLPLAEEQLRKALEIDLNANDPMAYGGDYQNLASVLAAQGRFAESETMASKAFRADQTTFGGEHPALVMDLFYEAAAEGAQGKSSEAEQSYRHALKIIRDSGDYANPFEALVLLSLGYLYNQQYRSQEALTQFTNALQIVDKIQKSLEDPLGPDAMQLRTMKAGILTGIGAAYYRGMYNFPAAEKAYQEALALLADTHTASAAPYLSIASQSLAEIYVAEGQPARAAPLYEQALQILIQRAPDSLLTAQLMSDLAGVDYRSLGKVQEAETLFSRSLQIKEKALGKNNPASRLEQRMLARIYCSTGRCEQAEPLIRSALAGDQAGFGPDNLLVGMDLADLGYFYMNCGHPEKAEPLYLQAIAMEEKALGPGLASSATGLIELYTNLAVSIRMQGGREAEAKKYEQRAKDISDKAHVAPPPPPPPPPQQKSSPLPQPQP